MHDYAYAHTHTYMYVYIYSMPYTQYITTLYYDQTPNKYIQSACCNPIVFDNVSMKFGIGIRSTGLVLPRWLWPDTSTAPWHFSTTLLHFGRRRYILQDLRRIQEGGKCQIAVFMFQWFDALVAYFKQFLPPCCAQRFLFVLSTSSFACPGVPIRDITMQNVLNERSLDFERQGACCHSLCNCAFYFLLMCWCWFGIPNFHEDFFILVLVSVSEIRSRRHLLFLIPD